MDWIHSVLAAALAEPLKSLSTLAAAVGTGGLVFWWDRWRQRPTIAVRVVWVGESQLTIEVENTSPGPNSLRPEVLVSGFDILYQAHTYRCEVKESERGLPSFESRRFTLVQAERGRRSEDVRFLGFPLVRVAATRGRPTTLRFADFLNLAPLGWWDYWRRRVPRIWRGKRLVGRAHGAWQSLGQEHRDRQGPLIGAECPRCRHVQLVDVSFSSLAAEPVGTSEVSCAACGETSLVPFDELVIMAEDEEGESPPDHVQDN
jgi:hypothetical protein